VSHIIDLSGATDATDATDTAVATDAGTLAARLRQAQWAITRGDHVACVTQANDVMQKALSLLDDHLLSELQPAVLTRVGLVDVRPGQAFQGAVAPADVLRCGAKAQGNECVPAKVAVVARSDGQ
jgi:hypothetical protein